MYRYIFTLFHKYDPKAIDNEESMYEIACVCFPILIDSIQLKYIWIKAMIPTPSILSLSTCRLKL